MNGHFRLIRYSDSAWHDRFFDFVASIFKAGRTFSDWGARGGWVNGYDVFAMVVDNQIVSTIGRTSMRYVINGKARNGYQIRSLPAIRERYCIAKFQSGPQPMARRRKA
jgi:hypothetical protein